MNRLLKSTISIISMTILAKFLGLLKEILFAQKFSISPVADAYMVAISFPTIVFTIFAGGFSNSYIPVFMRIKEKDKNSYFTSVFKVLLLISLCFMIICFLLSEKIVLVLAPGFKELTKDITVSFIKIIIFYLPFYTLFSILLANTQARGRFLLSNFCNLIVVNIVLIFSIVLSSKNNTEVLMYGYVFSGVFSFLILFLDAIKRKYIIFEEKLNYKDKNIKQLCIVAIPFGISSLINQLNSLVDKIFASSLETGVISALSYANKIQLLPYSLIISVMLTVSLPTINKYFAENNKEKAVKYCKVIILTSLYILIPIVIILYKFSIPIVKIIFERGIFDKNSTELVSNCLSFYALGMSFYSFREITTHILIANYKQEKVLKNTIISIGINIILNYFFIKILGYRGLALSTSLSGVISCLLMYFDLKKINLLIMDKVEMSEILKIFVSSIISVCIFQQIYNIFYNKISYLIFFMLIILLGVFYMILTYIFKVKIAVLMVKEIKKIKI